VAAGILLAGLGYLGFRSAHAADASTIWEPFFQAGARNAIVYGTPQFFSLDGLYLRDVNVNSPEDVKSDSRIGAVHRAISGDSQILAPDAPILYTGIGEAFGGQKMLRYFWEHSQHPETLLNSEADGRGMRDANLVVIASMRFRTLLDELQFPSDFTRIDGPGGNGEAILNSKPAASESKIYYSHRPAHSTQEVEYALVSLWPWRGGNHRVLLLSGTNTYATEAAVDFVTDPASLAQLERRLRAAGHPRYFQCLLRVFEVGTHVARVEYVTHHALPDPAPMVTAARGPSIKGIAP
jgi:hypothetical protein